MNHAVARPATSVDLPTIFTSLSALLPILQSERLLCPRDTANRKAHPMKGLHISVRLGIMSHEIREARGNVQGRADAASGTDPNECGRSHGARPPQCERWGSISDVDGFLQVDVGLSTRHKCTCRHQDSKEANNKSYRMYRRHIRSYE